jgi:hypothetical protein
MKRMWIAIKRCWQYLKSLIRSKSMENNQFAGLEESHEHEEALRKESMALVKDDPELLRRLEMIQKLMSLIFVYTIDHKSQSEDENTMQLLGVRLFNAAASGIKLALSGYYQTAFHQARDILEVGFLMDYFRTSPDQRAVWKTADRKMRREQFDPVKIRIALDARDNDTSKKRFEEYNKLSELASHANVGGFRLTTRGNVAELGPFVDKRFLLGWLEEMVLRLGPTAVMYANQFPNADADLIHQFQKVGTELVEGYMRRP